MRGRIMIAALLLVFWGFQAAAQNDDAKVVISGDFTTIYTLGNASDDQKIDDPNAAGAYFYSQTDGTRKNGYYTAANLIVDFRPADGLEGYFKLYSIHRPGSFHLPLQMENMGARTWRGDNVDTFVIDAVYGKANVFKVLDIDLPIDLYLKGGRYKAQAAQFGIISKYKTEQVLYLMNTKTDFTYELGVGIVELYNIMFSGAINYLFNESVQRYYDEDGALLHGNQVLNEYAPQFLLALTARDLFGIDAEILYGQNVSNIYSGNAIGFSAKYSVDVTDDISVPIGLSFAYFEKNVDLLGNAAVAVPSATAGNSFTMDFRDSIGVALGTGLRLKADPINLDFNLAGSFNHIKSYYRTDLNVIKLSADTMFTFDQKFFIGGGLFLGTLTDVEWKTRDDADGESGWEHTFKPSENMGFEIYGGLNLTQNARFVIGFNQNKGLSLNHMLEPKTEGQMKYKQADSNWAQDKLAEAGGLYFKFFFKF